MFDKTPPRPHRTDRWWLAPMRCGVKPLAALRDTTALSERYARSWLARSPVGIRAPLDAAG